MLSNTVAGKFATSSRCNERCNKVFLSGVSPFTTAAFNSNAVFVKPYSLNMKPCNPIIRPVVSAKAIHASVLENAPKMKVALPIAAPGKTTVGFIGIGIMGLAMARNLIKAGYDVIVWNRNTSKCAPLVEAGAKLATSPRDVTSRATYTFAMLSDPTAVLSAALGPNGAVAGLSPGKGYIDVSTVDAATSRQVGAAVSSAGGSFLEAPVSGSKGPAEQGTLIFLTAGDQELYTAVENPLKAMGKAAFFLGNAGAAAEMKLVVNMLMGGMMACFSESLVLAKKAGLEEKDLIDVIKLGAVAAPMFALKGPTMVKGAYNPAFPCKHQHKDMRLALELGEKVKMDLPVAKAAHALFSQAVEGGLGDLDFSAVIEAVKK